MKHKEWRAFTLIELMIVVVILGILTALAVTGYRKYAKRAALAEAVSAIAAIKAGEEGYFAERGLYIPLPRNPTDVPVGTKSPFIYITVPDAVTTSNYNTWGPGGIAVRPDKAVRFSYVVEAGRGAQAVYQPCAFLPNEACSNPAGPALFVDTRNASQVNMDDANPWYVIQAVADLDGNAGGTCTVNLPPDPGDNCTFYENIYDRSEIYKNNELK